MKCIRNIETDEVKRVSDQEAKTTVEANKHWHYTTKSVWKAAGRP